MLKIFIISAIIFFPTLGMFSQESISTTRAAYGIYGDYAFTTHTADFRAFPGVPSCCPQYDNGTGNGIAIGGLYELPLSSIIRLGIRAGYTGYGGTLVRTENTTLAGNFPGTFEHTVEATLSSIGIEPLLQYNAVSSLWLNLGGRVAYVLQHNFSQKELILEPNTGLFSNGSRARNTVSDSLIPEAQTLNAGLLGGLSYDLPLNSTKSLILSPEVLYYLPLTDIVQGVDWSANQLRLGLALKWSPVPGNDPIRRQERLEIIDTIRIEVAPVLAGYKRGTESATQEITESGDLIITTDIVHRTDSLFTALPVAEKKVVVEKPQKKKSALAATITASGLESDGRETQDIKIEVEEFTSVLMTPLLNYIFFEENSATLQPKYKQLDKNGIEKFREDKVNNPDRLTTYYQILNIIGKRMKINNDAMLTLTGCNADIGLEKGNGDVSKRRAEAVKSYLMDKWGIPESRIKVQQRNLPLKAANTQTPDGAQENRRVEFTSNNPAITAPVITNDTLRTVSPPSVRFRSQVITDNAISKWSLVAEQDSRTLKRFDGTGTVPKIMDWNIDEEKGTQPQTKSSLKYKLDVTDATDEHVDSENDIAVDQILISHKRAERIADKEIKRFSLILFDIRSTEITSANGSIIDLIKNEIKPNSKVTVTGYTDRLGDASTNKSLAEERAQNTATAIGIPSKQPNVVGKGNAATYNADVPEGRLYTRTVDVVVETPVK